MISAEYYYTVYLTIVTVLTLIICNQGKNDRNNTFAALSLCVFMVLYIGFRPVSGKVFVDMGNYAMFFHNAKWNGFKFDTDNLIFDNLYNYLGSSGLDITVFFILIASIYFGCILIACKKLFPGNVLLAFLVYLAAFSTFTYGTNGIKAGAAASIFLVALAYGKKYYISIPIALISWGFHHSMQLPVVAFVVSILFKRTSWYYGIWIISLICSLLHITIFQTIFAGWTDEQGAGYLNTIDADFVTHKGFRIDFVLYSVSPIIMGYYATVKYRFKDKLYDILLRTYLLTNAIWLLCMYAPFTNRISYLSWLMYPIVLIYPCMKQQEYNRSLVDSRNLIVGLHLGFTIFINVIYYNF